MMMQMMMMNQFGGGQLPYPPPPQYPPQYQRCPPCHGGSHNVRPKEKGLCFEFNPHDHFSTEFEITIDPEEEPDPLAYAVERGIMPIVSCLQGPSTVPFNDRMRKCLDQLNGNYYREACLGMNDWPKGPEAAGNNGANSNANARASASNPHSNGNSRSASNTNYYSYSSYPSQHETVAVPVEHQHKKGNTWTSSSSSSS